jgi:hypothetical protein
VASSENKEILALLTADKDELYSVLGAAALAVDKTPIELLEAGRAGEFYAAGPTHLGPGSFDHHGLRKVAENFLAKWGKEIRKAICGKEKLYAAEKKEAVKQVDIWVATLVATLTASIPTLGPFTVVLNILAVMIVRSGLRAFCDEILPSKK